MGTTLQIFPSGKFLQAAALHDVPGRSPLRESKDVVGRRSGENRMVRPLLNTSMDGSRHRVGDVREDLLWR
jgi:hypothetical protein